MRQRAAQVMWILDHQLDLEADFRAIYHLPWGEAQRMGGPRFLGLAYRVSAYPGVIQARIAAQQPAPAARGGTHVEAKTQSLRADPVLRDLIEIG